jgi:hypothetical protein
MAVQGLLDALNKLEGFADSAPGEITIPGTFLAPGFWAALAAFAWRKKITPDHIHLDEKLRGYFSAIGFSRAFGKRDDYPHERRNLGATYSMLEHLDNPEATDSATSAINGCVRNSLGRDLPKPFVELLCEVIGDLHANVWAHGKASGFSVAQRWKESPWNPLRNEYNIEFALADSGIGFLREVQRVRLPITTDREAIEWCIQEGHSTKKIRPVSDWAQRMPPDLIGNPMRGVEQTQVADNHHMGLGLAKLVRLVREFRGFLWLASGTSVLRLAPGSAPAYSDIKYPWKGVAMACRFRSSDLAKIREGFETGDKDIQEIMRILGGDHD